MFNVPDTIVAKLYLNPEIIEIFVTQTFNEDIFIANADVSYFETPRRFRESGVFNSTNAQGIAAELAAIDGVKSVDIEDRSCRVKLLEAFAPHRDELTKELVRRVASHFGWDNVEVVFSYVLEHGCVDQEWRLDENGELVRQLTPIEQFLDEIFSAIINAEDIDDTESEESPNASADEDFPNSET